MAKVGAAATAPAVAAADEAAAAEATAALRQVMDSAMQTVVAKRGVESELLATLREAIATAEAGGVVEAATLAQARDAEAQFEQSCVPGFTARVWGGSGVGRGAHPDGKGSGPAVPPPPPPPPAALVCFMRARRRGV